MRRVNWKVLGIVVVAGLAGSIGIMGFHRHQVDQTATRLKDLGLEAITRGDTEAALAHLGQYLSLRPADLEVRIAYVQQMDARANTIKAMTNVFMAMEQILRDAPHRDDIRLRLVQLAIQIDRPSDALAHIEHFQRSGNLSPAIITLYGQSLELKSEYRKAADLYEEAIQSDPSQVLAYERLAELYRSKLNLPAEGDRLIDQLTVVNNDHSEAYFARGRYLYRAGQTRSAIHACFQGLQRAPGQLDAAVLLSQMILETRSELMNSGEFKEAEQLLAKARDALETNLAMNSSNARAYCALAAILWKLDDINAAESLVEKGLKLAADDGELIQLKGQLLIERQRFQELEAIIDEFPPGGFWRVVAADLETSSLVAQGRLTDAIQQLQDALTHPDATTDQKELLSLRLARCERELGNHDLAHSAFRNVLKANASSVPARLGLAESLLRSGDTLGALNEYRQLRDVRHVLPLLVRLSITHNLRFPAELRDWDEAEKAVEEYRQRSSQSIAPFLLAADLAIAQGALDRANDILIQAEHKFPDNDKVIIAKSQLMAYTASPDAALQMLRDRRTLSDSVDLRLAIARHLQKHAEASASTESSIRLLADEHKQFDAKEEAQLLHGLALIAHEGRFRQLATQLWIRLAEHTPQDNEIQLHVFDSLVSSGELRQARDQVANLKRSFGKNSPIAIYADAILLILAAERDGNSIETMTNARRSLQMILAQRPHWYRPHTAIARVFEAENRQSNAIEHYRKALEFGESNPLVFEKLMNLLTEDRRFDEAEQLLHKFGKRTPELLTARSLQLASLAIAQSSSDHAMPELARRTFGEDEDAAQLAWLGLTLTENGHVQEAKQHIIKAIQIEGADPVPYIVYIRHLIRSGQPTKARSIFDEIQSDLEDSKDPRLLPAALEALGDIDAAISQLQIVVKNSPQDFPLRKLLAELLIRQRRYSEGLTVLKQIETQGLVERIDDQRWVRMTTAVALAGLGNYKSSQEALAILDSLQVTDKASTAIQRSRAFVLASSIRRSDREEAISLFKEIEQSGRLNPNERWLLAQLYDRMSNWTDADREFKKLLEANQTEVRYVADYTQRLLVHGEISVAERYFDRVQQLEPGSFRTLRLLLNLHAAQGRSEDALTALQAYVDRQTERERRKNAAALAAVADDLARSLPRSEVKAREWCHAFALQKYEQAVDQSPRNLFLLVQFLARRNRTEQALDWCERVWERDNPELAASMLIAALYFGDRSSTNIARVRERIEAGLENQPNSLPMLVSYAELRSLQGEYDDAETLYRRVLSKDPENLFALNNLAWLLAVRERNLGEAQQLIEKAVAKAGPRPDLLDTRACVALASRDFESALNDLVWVLEEQSSITALLHLAITHARRGDMNESEVVMARAEKQGLDLDRLHPLEKAFYSRAIGGN